MKKSHNDSTHGRLNVHEYFLYRETHYQNYHISFVYVKHAANYVISFELYVDFNSQKIMKLSTMRTLEWVQAFLPLLSIEIFFLLVM